MNREEFINYLNHPELLDKKSVAEMRELLHEFPYFQTVHLLFLKNLHCLDNIKFPSQLKISAAHITDREILYHLLHKKPVGKAMEEPAGETVEKKAEAPEIPAAELQEEKKEKITVKKEPKKPEPDKSEGEKVKPEVPPSTVTESEKKPSPEKIREPEKITGKAAAEEPAKHTKDELADQILKRLDELKKGKGAPTTEPPPSTTDKTKEPGEKKSIADTILDELSRSRDKTIRKPEDQHQPEEKEAVRKKKTERQIPGEVENNNENKSNPSIENSEEMHEAILLIDEEEEIIQRTLTKESAGDISAIPDSEEESNRTGTPAHQKDLLDFEYSEKSELSGKITDDTGQSPVNTAGEDKSVSEKKTEDTREKKTTAEKDITDELSGERFSFAVWLDLLQHPEEKIPSDNTGDRMDYSNTQLIDKFLESDPRIISPIEPEEDQEDISLKSVTEDEGFITDTLAQIYVKQGYYSKAIFAYEKLSLKFPEKSSYFASQIQKIKELIKKL
ncbi:MAG: hypothetical protein JSV24_00060 [Bacteroidales bacterium]|nr:MAG: hypothetical protein JSV24_00060 [Bacteroidales bacterium]